MKAHRVKRQKKRDQIMAPTVVPLTIIKDIQIQTAVTRRVNGVAITIMTTTSGAHMEVEITANLFPMETMEILIKSARFLDFTHTHTRLDAIIDFNFCHSYKDSKDTHFFYL